MASHCARTLLLAASTALSASCFPGGLKPIPEPKPLVEDSFFIRLKPLSKPKPFAEGPMGGPLCGASPRAGMECSVLEDLLGDRKRGPQICPRMMIFYGPHEEESPDAAPLLAALAEEMRRTPRLTDVQIVLAAGRKGEDVHDLERRFRRLVAALGELGVAPDRLSRAYEPTDNPRGYMYFESFACDGRELWPR